MAQGQLPKKLKNCPLVDAVVEVRFTPKVISGAVFGILYEIFKGRFSKVEQLVVGQFPPALLEADPNLIFQPHYKLIGERYSIQIGPKVVSISPIIGEYPGWEDYFPVVKDVLKNVFRADLVTNFVRFGIRYTNFFPSDDIFQKLNLKIHLLDEVIPYERTLLKTELRAGTFLNTLQISNDATRNDGTKIIKGSIIDIDTYKVYDTKVDLSGMLKDIDSAHGIEKDIFWKLLTQELQKELGATY